MESVVWGALVALGIGFAFEHPRAFLVFCVAPMLLVYGGLTYWALTYQWEREARANLANQHSEIARAVQRDFVDAGSWDAPTTAAPKENGQ